MFDIGERDRPHEVRVKTLRTSALRNRDGASQSSARALANAAVSGSSELTIAAARAANSTICR
jgi:hypothetical protein